ncbi:MAG: hypothetical protein KKI12_07205 [Proteobacteria bacterium]|nr:hypothetical protein [Pseudomonadota bacterium]MCG2756925.1 hypothetical protein [Desulfobacteraceae bacterium]
MKKLLLAIIILIIPSTCFASYIIQLKSGKEILVNRYWQEGDKIFFNAYGGTVGFPKDSIATIYELSDSDSSKKILPEKGIIYEEAPETDESLPTEKSSEIENKTLKDKPVANVYKDKKINLVARLKSQQKKLVKAVSAGKADMWIERIKRKIKDIGAEIDNLKEEVIKTNRDTLPQWWNELEVPPLGEMEK